MSREATGVRLDPRRGHIAISGESGPAMVTLTDTGQRLELWAYSAAHLSPAVARELGEALLRWADMRSERSAFA